MASVKIAMFGRNTLTCSSTLKNLKVLDVGGNGGKRAREEFYPGSTVLSLDIKEGYDVMKNGLPHGNWDIILANHFIEHIHDPDFFLDECKKVMIKDTILDMGMPNLAAWFNRIFFLFGYLPHSMELSYRYNLGKPFDWNKEELGGHIRVFTIPAFLQLLKYHGFKIISVKGERSTFKCPFPILFIDGFLTQLNPNLSSAFRIKCIL